MTTIVILKMEDKSFKNKQNEVIEFTQINVLLENYNLEKITIKADVKEQINKLKLPAVFNAVVSTSISYGEKDATGFARAKNKYSVEQLKYLKTIEIF